MAVEMKPEWLATLARDGRSHMQIAERIGVTRQAFSQVVRGERPPSVRMLASLIEAGLAETFDDMVTVTTDGTRAAT